MKMRKLAIAMAIVMIGSLAAIPLVRADDTDHDGVRNSHDQCPDTTGLGAEVLIGTCKTSVANTADNVGCSVAQRIADCLATVSTDAQFRTCAGNLADALQSAGLITAKQNRLMDNCARKVHLPH
jgi:hypothetical protein